MSKLYYDKGNGLLSKNVIEHALSRLAEFLKAHDKRVELVAAGGVVSVMVFGSREMTRDIDVLIPDAERRLIIDLVDQVADEQNLPKGGTGAIPAYCCTHSYNPITTGLLAVNSSPPPIVKSQLLITLI